MKLRRLLAPLLLAALPLPAAGAPAEAPDLRVLPPGARPHAGVPGRTWIRRDGGPPRVVEVIETSAPEAAWVEVEYSVDPGLEERLRGILAEGGTRAHVIVMDPHSGEVHAYVSTDPDTFPATRAYPTASLMKMVTSAALLRRAPDVARGDCLYGGSPYVLTPAGLVPPENGGTTSSFFRSLAMSNNQCFGRLALRLGREGLLREMVDLGVFEPPAVLHAAGRVEPLEDELDLAYLGSGLAGSYITPLAAARLAAALAEGELVHPWWVARVQDARGNPLALPPRRPAREVWSDTVASELRELLVGVTTRGTARRAFRDDADGALLGPIEVSGKTGTLNGTDPEGRYQWFAGVAPADAPRVAIAAVVLSDLASGAAQGGGAPEPAARSGAGNLDPGATRPPRRSAAQVAAATLYEVFCDAEGCDPERASRLRARSRTLTARAEREQQQRELILFREESELDRPPRPVGAGGLEIPRHFLGSRLSGEIVLLLDLDRDGRVQDARVDRSDLPELEEVVLSQVRAWTFTPPTHRGRPVDARVRLPIPIRID